MSRNRKVKVSSLAAAHANHAREVPLPFQDLDQYALSNRGEKDWKGNRRGRKGWPQEREGKVQFTIQRGGLIHTLRFASFAAISSGGLCVFQLFQGYLAHQKTAT